MRQYLLGSGALFWQWVAEFLGYSVYKVVLLKKAIKTYAANSLYRFS